MALLVGVIAAMLGIGGGVFIVPALQLLPLSVNFLPPMASGTSLAMILFTALSSTASYTRQKRIDYKIGLLFATVTVPGALLGAYATKIIPGELLVLIFAVFLLYVASRMIFSYNVGLFKLLTRRKDCPVRKLTDSDGKVFEYFADLKRGVPLGFFAGFFSGLLGIGGGALMVPILHLVLCFPMHLAVATSAFIMIFTSISGVATHIHLGNVQFDYSLLLSVGVILGAQIGAYAAKRTSSRNLRRIFGFVLVVISLRMILRFLGLA
jgi:uncharacterized membrane protein YfcA